MIRLSIIVAATATNGIGKNGRLPWHIHEDLRYFAHVTQHAPDGQQNAVIMGRKTWESIPAKNRPLSKRFNVVISNDQGYTLYGHFNFLRLTEDLNKNLLIPRNADPGAAVVVGSLEEALQLKSAVPIHRAFIIGGASLFNHTLQSTAEFEVDQVLVTRVTAPKYDCDTFMPEFKGEGVWEREPHAALVEWVGFDVPAGVQKQEDGTEYEFQLWTRQDPRKE